MFRTQRLSCRRTARKAPSPTASPYQCAPRWTGTRTWGARPLRCIAIGIGIGVGMGIGMGLGRSLGSQEKPQALLIACPASSHTVESDVSRRARTRATWLESLGASDGCCAASPVAVIRRTAGQRGIKTSEKVSETGMCEGAGRLQRTSAPAAEAPDEIVQHQKLLEDRKSTRLNSSHSQISYAVFCLKKHNDLFVGAPRGDQFAQLKLLSPAGVE